ncbi:MAG: GDP-mannose 4,6-dehydratase, partial [Thermomicrobiales bacterium]
MRTLVTGGLGMIGSHLVDALLDRGDDVFVMDNLLTGRWENLAHRAGDPRLRLVLADLRDPLPREIATASFDRIYHLASPASPRDYGRYPVETLLTNAIGTAHMLDLALVTGARFLLASTSEVYGDPIVHPQPESYRGHV